MTTTVDERDDLLDRLRVLATDDLFDDLKDAPLDQLRIIVSRAEAQRAFREGARRLRRGWAAQA